MKWLNRIRDRMFEAFSNRKKLAAAEVDNWQLLCRLKEAEDKNRQLLDQMLKFSVEAGSGLSCIESVMRRGIAWFDHDKLDFEAKVAYYNDAQMILKNSTLLNECDHLRADWARFCMAEAKDYEAVRDMRMCVNALELVFERLGSIPDPRKFESQDELHADL